jgi:hypothetical protein
VRGLKLDYILNKACEVQNITLKTCGLSLTLPILAQDQICTIYSLRAEYDQMEHFICPQNPTFYLFSLLLS